MVVMAYDCGMTTTPQRATIYDYTPGETIPAREVKAEIQRQMAEYDIDRATATENVADALGVAFRIVESLSWSPWDGDFGMTIGAL